MIICPYLFCPHCGSKAINIENDPSGRWYGCVVCGWSKPFDQVIVRGKTIITLENPLLIQLIHKNGENLQEALVNLEKTRQSNPRHGKYPL